MARTIENASDQDSAADRIIKVASVIGDEIDSGVLVKVEQLRPRLLDLAKTDTMKSSDRLIAETLIDLIAHEFTDRVQGGLISDQAQVKLSNLCDLVCESAEPFQGADEEPTEDAPDGDQAGDEAK